MPIKGKYFPSQVSGERVFLVIRRHWAVFAAMALLIVALSIPIILLIIFWLNSPATFSGPLGNFVIVFGGMYTFTVLGLTLYGFVNYYLDVYIVTNKRIVDIKQNGFFKREIAELHLHQVQDVEAKVDGFFQTLMHFGNIYIQTAGERENFVFEDVPHPYTLAKDIVELHEAQIETKYEPKMHASGERKVDDYRPEDYFRPESETQSGEEIVPQKSTESDDGIEESEGEIKGSEENYSPEDEKKFEVGIKKEEAGTTVDKPVEEFGFGAGGSPNQEKFEQELKELSEGEEVSLDDKDQGV